jgi:F-type H+-transporting ATPase subunit epsilon
MAGSITLEVATPERPLLVEQVRQVELPGLNGALGILPDHAALLTELGEGELVYTPVDGGTPRYMAVSGGWAEVLPDHVRVLAIRAELSSEIDVTRAEEALKRAEERLLNPKADLDTARALNALHRAQARLACARHAGIISRK